MKIFCIIVLYKPDWELLRRNLIIMIPHLDKIVLWDNTPGPTTMKQFEGVEVLSTGENIGLSRAYTEAWRIASAGSYDYLMTMDQDSQWENLPTYIRMVNEYEDSVFQKHHTLYFISTKSETSSYTQICCAGINSGAIIPIAMLNESHGYNTDFFVDAVDDWLIADAQKRGYNCIKVGGDTRIIQKYGTPKFVKVLGKKFVTRNYSAMRLYGIMRNYLILFQDYTVPMHFKKMCLKTYMVKMPVKILLVEKYKWKKIKAICCGIYDGLKKRPSRIRKFM